MSNPLTKVLNPKKTKMFWMYFVVSVLLIILGVLFMPVWGGWAECPWKDWGTKFLNIGIAIVILIYLFGYLIKKIKGSGAGVVKILTIIEFVILCVIAVGCILMAIPQIGGKLNVPNDACRILGFAIYTRGTIEVFRAYYHRGNSRNYPLWEVVLAIVFVTLGTWMYVRPFFTNITVLWIFVIIIFLLAILFFVAGFLAKPASKSKK